MSLPQKYEMRIQDRELELLRGLFDSRLMTLAQAAALFFNGSREAAKKRIAKLKAAGVISARQRKAYEPSILFLTRRGFELLRERGLLQHVSLSWTNLEKRLQVSDLTLKHELEVMDVNHRLSRSRKQRRWRKTEPKEAQGDPFLVHN
jgi:hypothetical protein